MSKSSLVFELAKEENTMNIELNLDLTTHEAFDEIRLVLRQFQIALMNDPNKFAYSLTLKYFIVLLLKKKRVEIDFKGKDLIDFFTNIYSNVCNESTLPHQTFHINMIINTQQGIYDVDSEELNHIISMMSIFLLGFLTNFIYTGLISYEIVFNTFVKDTELNALSIDKILPLLKIPVLLDRCIASFELDYTEINYDFTNCIFNKCLLVGINDMYISFTNCTGEIASLYPTTSDVANPKVDIDDLLLVEDETLEMLPPSYCIDVDSDGDYTKPNMRQINLNFIDSDVNLLDLATGEYISNKTDNYFVYGFPDSTTIAEQETQYTVTPYNNTSNIAAVPPLYNPDVTLQVFINTK